MKKIFMFLAVVGFITLSAQYATAQTPELSANELTVQSDVPVHQEIKNKFIEGGAGFMGIVLISLILGLAILWFNPDEQNGKWSILVTTIYCSCTYVRFLGNSYRYDWCV